jgi:predicted amidohydrolase YtcJ
MSKTADLIITNAKIFTSDANQPWAEALAVSGKRIIYVGALAGAEKFRGEKTRVVDAGGATVTAGFIDSHFHLLWGSIWLGSAQLQEVGNFDQLKTVMLDFAAANPAEPWVTGRGIKYSIVSTRQELDAIIADRPVYIGAYDGHTGWANTRALELAGILHSGEATGNGVVVRDENGLATGELRETAMNLVHDLVPVPDDNRKRELFLMALKRINATGVTSVHNMNGDMEELGFYAAREDSGEMTLRVYTPFWVKPEMSEADLQEAAEMAKVQGEFARGGAVKFFMDGVWESYTALTLAPYADNPDAPSSGIYEAEHFNRMAAACDKLGLQIFVHCCGDGAVRRALDGYEFAQKVNGKRDSRHRVEHIEVIHPDDLPRFQQLGVIASMQTSHAPMNAHDGDIWPARVGEGRWPLSFAWRDIKNAGARLTLGSDWTVAPFDPLINIYVAMNRKPWMEGAPDQRLTLEECLLGYTVDAAYAEFMENEKGQVKEGYLADLVMFSHDLFQLPADEILSACVKMTLVDGKVVYEA